MSFSSQLRTHVGTVFLNTSHFAESVTYTRYAASGTSTFERTINCVPHEEHTSVESYMDGRGERRMLDVTIACYDDTDGVTDPTPETDTITFSDGEEWCVASVKEKDANIAWLECVVYEPTEFSAEDWRVGR